MQELTIQDIKDLNKLANTYQRLAEHIEHIEDSFKSQEGFEITAGYSTVYSDELIQNDYAYYNGASDDYEYHIPKLSEEIKEKIKREILAYWRQQLHTIGGKLKDRAVAVDRLVTLEIQNSMPANVELPSPKCLETANSGKLPVDHLCITKSLVSK